MKARVHAATSILAGALLWLYTKSLLAGILCFVSGFLIDIDHILDYVIQRGWAGFTPKRFFSACEQTKRQLGEDRFKKIYLVFHGCEFVIIFWTAAAVTRNLYILAVSIGYSLHIFLDVAQNALYTYSYFIVWRAIKDFDTERLFRKEKANV